MPTNLLCVIVTKSFITMEAFSLFRKINFSNALCVEVLEHVVDTGVFFERDIQMSEA